MAQNEIVDPSPFSDLVNDWTQQDLNSIEDMSTAEATRKEKLALSRPGILATIHAWEHGDI